MKEPTLFDSFQHKGVWWFPKHPETRLPGVLLREGEIFTLELFDSGGRISTALNAAGCVFAYRADIVLGQLEDGKPCTLYQIHETNRPRNSDGFEKSIAEPTWAFIGAHFSTTDTIRFRSVTVEFTDLDAWMFDGSPFRREDIEEEGHFKGWRISQKIPEGLFVHVPTIKATVAFGYSASTSGTLTTHELSLTAGITIAADVPQSFEWYLAAIRDVQNWLTLLIGKPVQPARIEGSTVEYQTARVYPAWSGRRRDEPISPIQVRVKLSAIRDRTEQLLQTWFERSERLRDVYNLFFGAIHAEGMYVESQYLSLIQAVEAFSRATSTSLYVSAAQYGAIQAALVQAIPAETPSDLRTSLMKRVEYGNQYSLRKRLNELLKKFEMDTLRLICQNRAVYVEKVVATRNYLTHYTSELRAEAWHEDKLFYGCQSLTMLLTILLFKEIGLPEQRIRELLNGHSHSRQIIAGYRAQL